MGIATAIKNAYQNNSIESVFGVHDITSLEMKEAIKTWFNLYYHDEEEKGQDDCLRIPVQIVNKLYKTVFSEYNPVIQGSNRNFLSPINDRLDMIRKRAVQQALIGGECFIKPVLHGKTFDFVIVRRDCFVPYARDVHGRITDVGSTEVTVQGRFRYTLCERRTVGEDGTLTIESRLYRSDDAMHLGVRVPLDTLPRYARMVPVLKLPGIYNLGMVQVKTPMENTVDGSCDGVSVYAPAVGLIKNINRNERLFDQEFENGGSKIIASADMLTTDNNGKKRLNDSLFVAIDEDPDSVGVTIFNPDLREASFLARKQEYLRNCESIIGLKRGILSEVEATERTARAITSSEGDYNLTILDFQEMWENAVKELLYTCLKLGAAYKFIEATNFDIEKEFSIDWGDGVLYNRDKVWGEYVAMVNSGLLKPEIAVAWYFDMPYETEEDLQKVRDKYMPIIETIQNE